MLRFTEKGTMLFGINISHEDIVDDIRKLGVLEIFLRFARCAKPSHISYSIVLTYV